MKTIRCFLLCSLALTCFLGPLQAKPATIKGIPKDCKVHKPAYSQNFLNAELLSLFSMKDYETPDKTNQYWDVFSDRSHNETYMSSSGDTHCAELDFREPVRIARIKNGYALVYKTNDIPATFPQIPAGIEWKGWVPLTNLVMTEKVLTNELGVPISILIKDNVDFDSQLRLKAELFYDPISKPENIALPNSTNSIFYPVKISGSFILLATDTDISDPSHIYGWMRGDAVQFWKSRIAIEPTWDILDNDYLALVKHTSTIKGASDETLGSIDFIRRQKGAKFTPEHRRIHSGAWRFPVIFTTTDSTSCAIPAQSAFLDNPSQRVPVIAQESASETALDAQNVDINILFVIDGSRLYEPFFPILAERIGMIENQGNPSNIKVGALIYHDARSGEHMTELYPLTRPDDMELRDFVDMGGQYGFKDNLSEAPLLATLDQAIDRAGFDAQAQNFIILIGGRGDSSDSDLIPSDVAHKLAYANIGVYALQVQNNSGTAAYRMFGYLMEDILRQSVESKLETSVSAKSETNAEYTFTSYYADNSNATDIFDSYQAVNDGLMSENDFDLNLERILQRVNRCVDSSVGHSASLSSMYPQFFCPGKVESSWGGRKTFKEVALYSSADFDRLLDMLSRMNELHLISSTDRNALFSIIMEYLPPFILVEGATSYYPYNKMNEGALSTSLKKMGVYQLLSLIEGVPNDAYAGRPLKDVLSPKDVSDQEYLYILSDISRRYYRLLAIRNNPAAYSTYINNQSYFWVPREDLL